MKRVLFAVIILLIIGMGNRVEAQNKPKFGHINSSEILPLMPQYDSIQRAFQTYYASLEREAEMMAKEYETKLQEYMANRENFTPLLQQLKEKEIMDLQQRIQAFEASISDDLQDKKEALMQPLLSRFRKAVEEVAKEGKFDYVIDNRLEMLLYADQSNDITPLVKQKLNIAR